MRSAMPEIDRCYEDWLKSQPTLGGRMNVRFTISTDDGVEGQVSQVSVVDAGTGNIAFEGCVLSVISALRFEPPLSGETTVSYPLAFVAPPSPPEELQPVLVNLCQRMRSEAQRFERENVSPDDLLTAVISSLEEQTPGLAVYFAALLPSQVVPPVQRKETFKRAISKAIGKPWVCPEFEALWEGKAV
jgi:TonB family protein